MSQLLNMYSIYDEKANVFNTPFFAVSDGVAVRQFTDLVADNRSVVCAHPEDFSLYRCACFDDVSALVTPELPVHLICRAVEVLQPYRGAAVGGETPLKSQSDHPQDCDHERSEA